MNSNVEKLEFQAETKQLLNLMIHSLYTNKEIFLRELISNSSDALDKLRFESLSNPALESKTPLEIRLEADSTLRTLTLHDNGIGMTREELIKNIGTIAHSGTKEMIQKLKESGENLSSELIGQFGVGFYSVFMVADKVELTTRKAGEKQALRWVSEGDGSFEISEATRGSQGTSITLFLKEEDSENNLNDYTDTWEIKRIIKKYSDFVSYPILLKETKEEPELDAEGNAIEGQTVTTVQDVTVNSMKPIWTRNESDVQEEEFTNFYKHISHDWREPMERIAVKAEGMIEYRALLFLPSEAPMDLYYYGSERGLQLYVRKVLIMEKCEDLLPNYLRFVKGVVDSSDLPLNVSRELLQQDRHITQIRKYLTKQILSKLEKTKKNSFDQYVSFWGEFGKALKEGVPEDYENRQRITDLLLFQSSHDPEKWTSLEEYVGRMKEGQDEIYFITGETRERVENSPHIEAFLEKGIEVLYLLDPVDEIVSQHLHEYKEKKLHSVEKGTVELGTKEEKETAEKERKEKQEEVTDLLKTLQESLSENVKEVRLSSRLKTSAVCLVGEEHDMSPQFERLLKKSQGTSLPKKKRILEVNPNHEIFSQLKNRYEQDAKDPRISETAELLFGTALLAEGSELVNPKKFNDILTRTLASGLK